MFKALTVNGLNVLYQKTHHDIVNLRIIVGSGAYNETTPDTYGVAHFLEHMFFKGTTKRDYKEINRLTSLYGDINAYTSRHVTTYHFNFLRTDLVPALQLLMEMVFQPAFPEDEFEKEKGVIVQEYQTYEDSPNGYFYNHGLQRTFADDDYGHPVIGSKESVQEMTIRQMRTFHAANYFNRNNIVVAICGNVEEADVVRLLAEAPFAKDYQSTARKEHAKPNFDLTPLHIHHKSKQAMIALAFEAGNLLSDIGSHYAGSVMTNAVGQGMHSLLFERIREELGLCYSVSSSYLTGFSYGLNYIQCLLEEDKVDFAIEEILKVLADVAKNGISDELMEVVRKNELFYTARKLEVSAGINREADQYFNLYPGWVQEPELLNAMSSFAATAAAVNSLKRDDIVRAAQVYAGPYKVVKMTQAPEFREPVAAIS